MKTLWTAILGATIASTALFATDARSNDGTRSYASGRFAFGIDGQFAGYIKKVSGGTVKGEVGTPPEPLTLETGPTMGQPMFEWIKASWDQGYVPRSIDLRLAETDHTITTARTLEHTRIDSVTVPALDGSSKDPCYFTVRLDPEVIRYEKAHGKLKGAEDKAQKKWLCSNFKLELGDLPTTRVSKIDSFNWKQTVVRDKKGKFGKANAPKVSDIRLTISMGDYDAWAQWHKKFVIDGKAAKGDEKTGSLTFLGPDHKGAMMSIELEQVGIVTLSKPSVGKSALAQKLPAQFEVTLSVGRVRLGGR